MSSPSNYPGYIPNSPPVYPTAPKPHPSAQGPSLPVLPEYSRSEIFKQTVGTNFKKVSDLLLQPFVKLAEGRDLSLRDKLVLILSPVFFFVQPITAIVTLTILAVPIGHALFFTAIGKLPEGYHIPPPPYSEGT